MRLRRADYLIRAQGSLHIPSFLAINAAISPETPDDASPLTTLLCCQSYLGQAINM